MLAINQVLKNKTCVRTMVCTQVLLYNIRVKKILLLVGGRIDYMSNEDISERKIDSTKKMSKYKKSKKRRKMTKTQKFLYLLIFLVGFSIMAYPQFSNWYYRIESNNIVKYFDEQKDKLSSDEIKKRIDLAKAYNMGLHNAIDSDPYSDEKKEEGRKEYARMLQIKEYIGHVEIPKINEDIPIYAGTTEEVLQKGAGHLEGTSLPIGGINTHAVITAHTGLPKAKMFTNLTDMKKGDIFYVHNIAEVLAYKVDQIMVVEPSNFDNLLVVRGRDYVTLLTCTPYMINTHRLLVRGHRVPYVKHEKKDTLPLGQSYLIWIIVIAILLLLLLLYIILKKRKKNKNKADSKVDDEVVSSENITSELDGGKDVEHEQGR